MAVPAQSVNLMNAGHFYTNLVKPIDINLNFIVDSANGNGLGVRSVKSNGYVNNVFMHTSASAGSNNGQTNPNPAVGYIVVQLKGNYNRYIGGFAGEVIPTSGSNLTSVTAGNAYIITGLGTATQAQWNSIGLQPGITPVVGASFIASASTSVPASGTVKAPGISPVLNLQPIGDFNASISNSNQSANAGAYMIFQVIAGSSPALATPADGTIIGMTIRVDGSSVNVDGL